MIPSRSVGSPAALLAALLLLPCLAWAQAGPDVIVGDLTGPSNFAAVGGIYAYALGTTSCNKGTSPLAWVSGTNQHPVIGQNLFRIKNGRFEQLGQAWLKHGFTALQGTVCFSDCVPNPTGGNALGVHCSDPYGSGLNGQQSGLGPKFEVNPATGYFPYPFTSPSYSGSIARRLQAAGPDVDPLLNAGAVYLAEGQYVTPDDAAAGNKNNNASYRPVTFAPSTLAMSFAAPTVREKTAIEGWKDLDSTVTLTYLDIPGDGRMILALKTIPAGGALTRYEYALHNLNSDRAAATFIATLPAGATVNTLYFHDVPYHSGEPFDGTDWLTSWNGSTVEFRAPQTYAQNQYANALRWGTCYTFSFLADAAPTGIRIDLFKPGTPSFVAIGPVFSLDLATTGGGSGDLHLGVNNIPTSASQGYCVFSFNATLPLGGGNLLGIYPDYVSLVCLLEPLAPGDIFHWAWPVSAPLFPATAINLPPGAVPFPAGTHVDGVAFVLGPGLAYQAATAPVRVTF